MADRLFRLVRTWLQRISRRPIGALVSLSCLGWLLLSVTAPISAQQTGDAREFIPNVPIERDLAIGETHVYKIALAAGTYLRVGVDPGDGDVESRILAPGGAAEVGVTYFPRGFGVRFVSLVAEVAGDYRLEVSLPKTAAKTVRYVTKLEELRPATESDRLRGDAENAETYGRLLLNQAKTAEQSRQVIARLESALALWRRLGDRKGEMRMLTYLSIQLRDLGEMEAALAYARQAIELARAEGDRYQEANLTSTFGVLYRSQGEYQKALDTFRLSRRLFQSLSAKYGEALDLYKIGTTLARLGDLQESLRHLNEALPTLSANEDTYSECNTLNQIGAVHRRLGDAQKAIEFHNRALAIARRTQTPEMEATSLGQLGHAHLSLGDRQKALDFYGQAVPLCREVGNRLCEGDGLKMSGDVMHQMGDNQKALDLLTQSLLIFRIVWEREREGRALHSLAQVNLAFGNFDEARRQIEMALEIQESLRANLISQQLREAIFTSTQGSFALYIDLLMQLHKKDPSAGHDAAALQASERARARSLLELLTEAKADIRQGVPEKLLEAERSLRQQISAKEAARTRLLQAKRAAAAALNGDIADLTSRHRDVEVQIRQNSPRYAALTQPRPLTAAEIQQLLDNDTVLLEFYLGEKQSWLWAVTRTSLTSYHLPSTSEIEPAARKVYELLTARQPRKGEPEAQYQARVAAAEAQFPAASASLGRLLFSPIAAKLHQDWKGKRLAIVASDALEYIPFASLSVVSGQGSVAGGQKREDTRPLAQPTTDHRPPATDHRPLITDHEVINLPSASALAAIRSETAGRRPAEKAVAVIADPVFEPTDARLLQAMKKSPDGAIVARVRSGSEAQATTTTSAEPDTSLARAAKGFRLVNERGGFSRLPFSREEADNIAALAPTGSLLKALDFRANRAIATSGDLSHYRIIHFATHGLLNSEQPELSGLVLSLVDENGQPQDGFLRLQDIYNLSLPADLVVLSACQTALGKQIKGEGLVGLTRGFMYAGVRRVVASLWQVDDLATAQLMKTFYRGVLKDGLPPAAALRAAQLELAKQKRWSSPFYWAAFTIQGEWK